MVLDNLPAQQAAGLRGALIGRGAWISYLPPLSPDMNPLEMAFVNSRHGCAKTSPNHRRAHQTASATCSDASFQPNVATPSMRPIMCAFLAVLRWTRAWRLATRDVESSPVETLKARGRA